MLILVINKIFSAGRVEVVDFTPERIRSVGKERETCECHDPHHAVIFTNAAITAAATTITTPMELFSWCAARVRACRSEGEG